MVNLAIAGSMLARMGEGFGRGGGGGPLWIMPIMGFFGLVVAFLFVLFIYYLVRQFYRNEIVPRKYPSGTPLDLLQRRYAAGQITSEEFEKIKQGLM